MRDNSAFLLDVSRLISRLCDGPATGIDRVEAEWLAHLVQSATPHLLLARVRGGQLLLPPEAAAAILRWTAGDHADLPRAGPIDRLRGRRDLPARAQAALRAMAIMRGNRAGSGIAARAHRAGVRIYLNVGHSNLTRGLWAGLAPLTRAVLIHDTIPLDYPEFTRAGQSDKFRARFCAAVGQAELVLTISEATRRDVIRWRTQLGLDDRARVEAVPIGTRLVAAGPACLPVGLDLDRPFFVTLGTIEPRKNHALLLDAWQILRNRLTPAQMPQLFIIGRRGWENQATFSRLDRLAPDDPIRELNGLTDAAVAHLLTRSHGLLMPSHAEGFGLPLTEAAARGVPVICAPLPVARELLGDYARYLGPDNPDGWADMVAVLAQSEAERLPPLNVPQWDAHFAMAHAIIHQTLHGVVPKDMPQ